MRVRVIAATILLVALSTCPALAQTATAVSIPYGDWIAQAATIGVSIAGSVIAWGMRQLPARYVALVQATHADKILEEAVCFALNAVPGATKGKVLTVDVGNPVLQQAVTYVISNAPGWLVTWLGGEAGIAQRIVARLTLDESAGVTVNTAGVALVAS